MCAASVGVRLSETLRKRTRGANFRQVNTSAGPTFHEGGQRAPRHVSEM